MKKSFKFLFAAIILVVFGTTVFAQTNQNATVSANVLTSLSLANSANIDFGQVVTLVTPTLDNVAGTKANCGATATFGKFLATGTNGATFIASWTTPIVLTAPGPKNLDFNPTVSQADGNVGTAFGGANHLIATVLTFPASTFKTFWVGGTLTNPGGGAIAAGKEGVYSGTFTLTVQYN